VITRAVRAARLQLVNPLQAALPWLILTMVFVFNLIIFRLVPMSPEVDERVTGGLAAIYVFVLVAHLQTMTQVFPFALGLSVTRREFFAGTSLLILAQAVLQGLAITLMAGLENATGGWGLDILFFRVPVVVEQPLWAQFLIYTVPFVALGYTSVFIGTVFKRWNQLGMYVLGLGSAVLFTLGVLVLNRLEGWPALSRFLVGTPVLELTAGYPALIAVGFAAVGFLVLRRATP
jgi:hypothetical protein